jgi:hypothetical protein
MGVPTVLDAIVLAPAAILGLIGVWLGLRRSLVAWPMRWLIPFFGACIMAAPVLLGLTADGAVPGLPQVVVAAATVVACAVVFALVLVLLLMFMRNLRERMGVWRGGRRAGLIERAIGGLFGIACGVMLVGFPYGVYDSMRPASGNGPAWALDSVALPYFAIAASTVRDTVSFTLRTVAGNSKRQR